MSARQPVPLTGIEALVADFDALILDLWGVIHDGQALYPGAYGVLERLHEAGKPVIFVSNAPRRAMEVMDVLRKLKIPRKFYKEVITSGETAFEALRRTPGDVLESPNTKYFYFGPDKDAGVLHGLGMERVRKVESAGFVASTGFNDEHDTLESKLPMLEKFRSHDLLMLCLNPDRYVVRQSGVKMLCAGEIAEAYTHMGGKVVYFGKPYPAIYELALKKLGKPDPARVLAIGDGMETDIPGACAAGIPSVLVTGGILKVELGITEDVIPGEAALGKLWKKYGCQPDYVMSSLRW